MVEFDWSTAGINIASGEHVSVSDKPDRENSKSCDCQ